MPRRTYQGLEPRPTCNAPCLLVEVLRPVQSLNFAKPLDTLNTTPKNLEESEPAASMLFLFEEAQFKTFSLATGQV